MKRSKLGILLSYINQNQEADMKDVSSVGMSDQQKQSKDTIAREDSFLKDAREGLTKLDKNKLPILADFFDAEIAKHVRGRRNRMKPISLSMYIFLAVIILIMALAVSAWMIFKLI